MIHISAASLFQKEYTFLAFFFLGYCHAAMGQLEISAPFDLQDRETLLIRLFDSDSISNKEEVLWKPLSFSDLLSSNISSDGYVHTALDTIMYVNANGVSLALALFETMPYENGFIVDCPSCGAQVSAAVFDDIGDGQWQIIKFAKHFTTQGGFGLNAESGLTQFGSTTWCLRLQMSWLDQGFYGEYVTYFDLDNFQKVFNFAVHEDNMAAFEDDPDRAYAFDKSIHFIPNMETESGWWDFDMVMQGTQKDEIVERAVPANIVTRYHFDWETNTYLKSCR